MKKKVYNQVIHDCSCQPLKTINLLFYFEWERLRNECRAYHKYFILSLSGTLKGHGK